MMATQYRKRATPVCRVGISLVITATLLAACSPQSGQMSQSASASSSSVSLSISSMSSAISSGQTVNASEGAASSQASSSLNLQMSSASSKSSRSSSSNPVSHSLSSSSITNPSGPTADTATVPHVSSSSPPSPPAASSTSAQAVTENPEVTAPALNLDSLEQRLRDTKAIGVFTKLSLKNQVDDLLNDFRTFYRGKSKLVLTDLRQRYDLLVMKILTLLQDSDTRLAADIRSSREAIWNILQDPKKFAEIS